MANKIVGFLKEARTELKKVSWPTKDELIGSTVIVIVVTLLLVTFIGICDYFLSRGIGLLIR
ncbi:MAG: preprotein translocase subunit SecE [Candidatus Omnitrophota bacterium]|nr:preprotein translocase subunit SecE [Candidatus Omnitrophota bacterium]